MMVTCGRSALAALCDPELHKCITTRPTTTTTTTTDDGDDDDGGQGPVAETSLSC